MYPVVHLPYQSTPDHVYANKMQDLRKFAFWDISQCVVSDDLYQTTIVRIKFFLAISINMVLVHALVVGDI